MFRYSANLGLLISRPTNITFLFIRAKDIPKLQEKNDLPSPLILDVINITFSFLLLRINWIFVLISLNNSTIGDVSPSLTTRGALLFVSQISPNIGIEVIFSNSCLVENLVLSTSFRYR